MTLLLEPDTVETEDSMHGRVAVLCASIVMGAGCARPGEVHVAPDESKPHLSWEIRSGTAEGDGAFVCGSAQPGRPCVLAASTEDRQTFAAVHLLAHAAAQPTSYLGFMRPTFLEGDTSRKLGELNVTVEPGSRPVGTTVLGRVTSEAGSYELIVSVDATQQGLPAPQHIPARVPVEVK